MMPCTTPAENYFLPTRPTGLNSICRFQKKEIPFQGVFRVKTSGDLQLITDTIARPNGIAFFPGEKTFLVANSDGEKPNWYAFNIDANNEIHGAGIFYSTAGADRSLKGGCDGLKIDKNGNVFATGPGGIWIFNSSGKLLGKLRLTEATSNCALSADEKTLYITNDMYLVRFRMR